ncbi:FecR family protein [Opitutus terrae]|uniref:Anti-FecI sigma factor, FecR n=1 Tax=Opitutus terrae (strain DSM 11246 / JCM 15787 / PB90-1) TaxID=452637 RepID=B1ZVB4_OPITP|nr:FecR domain-containing protein [Opitutus terrae]ACB76781.1 anti-FecI sigma factor, FecR [Opitutus terrae PB90-1]
MKTRRASSPAAEAIEAEAAAWLARLDGGITPDERAEFFRWREADSRHAAAFARLEQTWRALHELRSYRPLARLHPDRDLLAPPPRGVFRRRFPMIALAAAAAVIIGWTLWSWAPRSLQNGGSGATQIFATTSGGYERLTLSDGSVVELNGQSEVRVAYRPEERRIQLTRGEAHFIVAKNHARPFIVTADKVAVRAVGTAFDVRLADRATEVLVTEGRVQLDHPGSRNPPATGAVAAPATLDAGWRAVVGHASGEPLALEQLSAAAISEALAWQRPRLVFTETPLREVIARFNQHNRVQLALADPELGSLPVGGSFRAENVDAFVRLLTSNGELVAEPAGDVIVLRRVR